MGNEVSSEEIEISDPQPIQREDKIEVAIDFDDIQPIVLESGRVQCLCGQDFRDMNIYHIHLESTFGRYRCPLYEKEKKDVTGWTKRMVDCIPYAKLCQRAVIDHGKKHSIFLAIKLDHNVMEHAAVKKCLSKIPKWTDRIMRSHNEPIVSVVGVQNNLWKRWDQNPPKHLIPFTELKQKDTDNVLFPSSNEDLFVFVKSDRLDLCNILTSKVIRALTGVGFSSFSTYVGFVNQPTTEHDPNMAKDLTGFVDGTRNPDHLLRALIDEALIFSGDDEGRHTGGSYMYAGRFIHDLLKFHSFSHEEKSQIIGRDYSKESSHRGYDHRAENPRLDVEEYHFKGVRDGEPVESRFHTNRGHGSMYRQAMPYISNNEQGLYFICFSRSLNEIDMALKRMSGHFTKDNSTDALLDITRAVTSNYYYCPSLEELETLTETPVFDEVVEKIQVDKETDLKIVFEYCTNCGYFTIYQKARAIIEKIYPKVRIIENPKNPRLAAFEIYTENGFLIFSKLSLPNGMNNYPECFPTGALLIGKMREYLNLEPLNKEDYSEEDKKPIVWGLTDWEDLFYEPKKRDKDD
jgi:putative iron-dependent peroxidase